MADKFGIEKIIEQSCATLRDNMLYEHAYWTKDNRVSPIEALFMSAFHNATYLHGHGYHLRLAIKDNCDPATNREITITFQEKIDIYKADHVIRYRGLKIVVECDGHEFHSRTKEQAQHDRARDRRMQALGFIVLRFTGAELYRDGMRCAKEVMALISEFRAKAEMIEDEARRSTKASGEHK